MQSAIKPIQPHVFTRRQKTLSSVANVNSAVGHTVGIFGGITIGVNVAKAMDDTGINSGISIATGIISAIAVMAGVSIATEAVSGEIRKKADIPSPFSMLCTAQHSFDPVDYSSLLKNIEEGDYDFMSGDNQDDGDNSVPGDAQEPENECDS